MTAGSGLALTFNAANNRITKKGYYYDAAGNLTEDPGHSYIYDAENKIIKLDNVTAYAYDGEGKRVRKYVGENTRFVYGIGGQLLAEYNGSSGAITKEYIYGASGLTAVVDASNGTEYLTPDHLGSPRVTTNSSASVTLRRDFMPFGEEVTTGAGRTSGGGWASSNSPRQKFTGYERDAESGLDFAQARYYSNSQGRFTGPDPLLGSGKTGAPQTWNRYAYVLNNALGLIDPSGMAALGQTSDSGSETQETQRKVYIFIFLTKDEQRRKDKDTGKRFGSLPDFEKLKRQAPKGTEVIIKGAEGTLSDFQGALQDKDAAGVIFVGHGSGEFVPLGDGTSQFFASNLLIDSKNEPFNTSERYGEENKVPVKAGIVALFGCSVNNFAEAFRGAGSLIATSSGRDGLTDNSVSANSALSAAEAIISGKTPDQVMLQANQAFTKASGPVTVSRGRTDTKYPAIRHDGDYITKIW